MILSTGYWQQEANIRKWQEKTMFRLWAKEWAGGHLIREITIEDGSEETRTHKVFHALTRACHEFDLPEPIWLDQNIRDFQRRAKCRFSKDSFVEEIPFDYLEIEIVEEDPDFYG